MMDNSNVKDRYSLRWNNYSNNISQVFDEHLRKEALVDVTLCCEGEFIKAHKLILSACSDYFRDLFNKHTTTPHPIIVFHSIKAENLKNLLQFMYHGEIKVLENEIEDLLLLGESLHVKGLCSVKFKRPSDTSVPQQDTDVKFPKSLDLSEGSTPPPLVTFTKKDTAVKEVATQSVGAGQVQSDRTPGDVNLSNSLLNAQVSTSSPQVSTGSPQPAESLMKIKHFSKPNILQKPGVSSTSKDKVKTYSKSDKPVVKAVKPATELKSSLRKEDIRISKPQASSNKTSPVAFTQTIKVRNFGTELDNSASKRRKLAEPEKAVSNSNSIVRLSESDSPNRAHSSLREKSTDTIKPVNNLPKPPNAFMIFASEWRKKLSIEHPTENSKEINYKLGNMWKAMSIETKNVYYQAAQKAAEEYNQKVSEAEGSHRENSSNSSKPAGVVHAVQLLKLVMTNPEPPRENIENQNVVNEVYIKEEEPDDHSMDPDADNRFRTGSMRDNC